MPTALLRDIPSSFDRALVSDPSRVIDVEHARTQHRVYESRLADAGLVIEKAAPDEALPDCVFIEDTAVIVGEVALITCPGAPTRRGETRAVADALVSHFTLEVMDEPATMDGGDIFIMGGVVYAGRSGRTNDHGLAQLETLARRQGLDMVVVDVLDGLHLKSAVRPIGPETVVVTQGAVDESRMPGLRKVAEAIGERFLFSALPLGPRLLATASSPKTNEAVAGLGFEVDAIDVSEILAADGGLTCMSIIF